MSEHLLSLIHIQKLEHPIEEIRNRALSTVISKHNLNLVDENNLENAKLLLKNLFKWFDFEKFSEAEKVFALLLQIFKYKTAGLLLKEFGYSNILKKLKDIEKKIGHEYSCFIQNINQSFEEITNDSNVENIIESECAFNTLRERDLNCPKSNFENRYKSSVSSETNKIFLDQSKASQIKDKSSLQKDSNKNFCYAKIKLFPWMNLMPNDKKIFASIFNGLKYIDNKPAILHSCFLFKEILLQNFPAQIFVQRPLIVRTLLQLIEPVEEDIQNSIIVCLITFIKSVQFEIHKTLNSSLFNQKQEYYKSSTFNGNLSSFSVADYAFPELLNTGFLISIDDFQVQEEVECNDDKLKKYQVPLLQFCFEILLQVLPLIGKTQSEEGIVDLIELTHEVLNCTLLNLVPNTWLYHNDIKDKFYKIFVIFQELLKLYKETHIVIYIILLYFIVKLLNYLAPPSNKDLVEVLPRGLQMELVNSIFDVTLKLMFPYLHGEVLKYIGNIGSSIEKEALQDYKDICVVLESMSNCKNVLECFCKNTERKKNLKLIFKALPALDFTQSFDFIESFVKGVLLAWSKVNLKDEELKLREKILLKLLAHSNNFVKTSVYQLISNFAVKYLGEEEAIKGLYEFPGDKMEFLFHVDVLTEIICHGLNSQLPEVRRSSLDIITYLLKSQYIMSESCWNDFINALIPCMCLLQCYADKSTHLGRCIVKLFDPDVAALNGLSEIEVLKGNIRFLFSKNHLVRDEALSRLLWLLTKEDPQNLKLPRMSVLAGLSLSGICSSVKPEEFTTFDKSFYNPAKLCDVLEILSTEVIEPNIRRSALSQISVMMDDVNLHSTFVERNGLFKITKILDNCLIEKDYHHFPDSIIPIVNILKALLLHNASLRLELSSQIKVFYNLLRGLLLFSSDEKLRREAVESLCLLVYNDCIMRVPPEVTVKCTISVVELVVSKMCLPLMTHVHGKASKNLEPSMKKTIMSKSNYSKLIRTHWAALSVESLPDLLSTLRCDFEKKVYPSDVPEDLKICYEEIECLRKCSFALSIKKFLYNIQNATTHASVFTSITNLKLYFLLYNIDKLTGGREKNDIISDKIMSHMVWEATFENFMLSRPSCTQDEILLLKVIQFIEVIIKSIKSDRLICWTEKLLTDENQALFQILRNNGNEKTGSKGRELQHSIISLVQLVITNKSGINSKKWLPYMQLISEQLKLDRKKPFHHYIYTDLLISFLVDLTGKYKWNFTDNSDLLQNLVTSIMDLVVFYHCQDDAPASFIGTSLVKNSLLALNHILTDAQHVDEWENLWFSSLSKVTQLRDAFNYSWICSFFFMKDPIARASAFEIFVGFSLSSRSCSQILAKLNIPHDFIWKHCFEVLFDERESCLVKEKCALLLSNLVRHEIHIPSQTLLDHLLKINFYAEVFDIVSNYQCENKLAQLTLDEVSNVFLGDAITTPSFVSTISTLLQNIIAKHPNEVPDKIVETGIMQALTRVLGELPESSKICENHRKSVDIIRMYINVCKLFVKCAALCSSAKLFLSQSQVTINYFFMMLNYTHFCEVSSIMMTLRTELWCEILNLFSTLLSKNPETNESECNIGFITLNKCLTDNGIDHFILSLYIALTGSTAILRVAALNFLINLFSNEKNQEKRSSISDIFDRHLSKFDFDSVKRCCSKELNVQEYFKKDFGTCLVDVLLQIFLISFDSTSQYFKITIANALGNFLAVYQPAQNFCINQELSSSLIMFLKQMCMELNLDHVSDKKKGVDKKRGVILLSNVEILFQLITNFIYNNKKAKADIAIHSLAPVVHKLWPWCIMKPSLLLITLKMVSTFSHSCEQGCRSLLISTNFSTVVLKKSPGSTNLLNAIINLIVAETDLTSKKQNSDIVSLCLQIVSNCCCSTECRAALSKGTLPQTFIKFYCNRKKKIYSEETINSWLNFFVAFSSYQEGQLALTKIQGFLDLMISIAEVAKPNHRVEALTVLRNICFHQLNRIRMLSYPSFLSLLIQKINSQHPQELKHSVIAIWALACNSQKSKLMLRNAGFDVKLESAKRACLANEDTEISSLISIVLSILKNK